MKNRYLFKVGFACALLCASMVYSSCGNEDEPTPSNQNTSGNQNQNPTGGNNNQQTGGNENEDPNKPVDEEKLVSELKCTVDEFATKYTTLKKGEKVTVTLTDVSDANIAKVSETLKAMQTADPISKAGEAKYMVTLILESISNAFKTIPADTFKGVEVLREVVIPACVEAIQSDAFAECVNLVSAKILGADTKVDEKAFESANEEIKVEQTQKEVVEIKLLSPADIVPYVNASNEEIVTLNMPLDTYDEAAINEELRKIENKKVNLVIPEGVNKIGDYAFNFCSSLAGIKIPESVTVIGKIAFQCTKITSIKIPAGVTEIGSFTFNMCSELASVVIPESVTKIGECAFCNCTSLTSIVIPGSVTEFGNGCFSASVISSITIPESITVLPFTLFLGCENLSTVTIPASVTFIDREAFDNCENLETIYCSQAIYDEYHEKYPQMVVKK